MQKGSKNAISLINHFVQKWEPSRRNLLREKRGQLTREIGWLKIIVSFNIKVEIFRTFPEKKSNVQGSEEEL